MKRITFALVCAATLLSVMTGCKAKKEAYYAASERAKAQQEAMEAARKEASGKSIAVIDNNGIRETRENIQIISEEKTVNGSFGVVVGSFTNRTNAEGLLKRMQEAGYSNAVLGRNNQMMYRVIVAFYQNKSDAQAEVGKLRQQFPDAWILVKE